MKHVLLLLFYIQQFQIKYEHEERLDSDNSDTYLIHLRNKVFPKFNVIQICSIMTGGVAQLVARSLMVPTIWDSNLNTY
jgi:hypothetical protein